MFLSLTTDPDGKAKYEKVIKKVLDLAGSLKVYPEKWLDCYKEYAKNPTGFMCTKLGNPCYDQQTKDFATDIYLPYDSSIECTDGDTATKHIKFEGNTLDNVSIKQKKIDCEWNDWVDDGVCQSDGTKKQKRTKKVSASGGGVECSGGDTQTVACTFPVDCSYSDPDWQQEWSPWSGVVGEVK